jgi:hypothetical protein
MPGRTPVGLWLAAIWGLVGLVRGFAQPAAWPASYATRLWVVRLGAWAAGLAALALGAVWYWSLVDGTRLAGPLQAVATALAVSVFPATLLEIRAARRSRQTARERSGRRSAHLVAQAVSVIAILVILLGAPFAAQSLSRLQQAGSLATAQAWGEATWERMNNTANALLDQWYLNYYDKRARSVPTLVPTPEAAPALSGTPTASGAAEAKP